MAEEKRIFGGFDQLSDEDLVLTARDGDNQALEFLLDKYRGFVRKRSRTYFLIGADREDLIQEGMIGLFKAIRDFNADKLTSFRAFAELCVTRQIITAVKMATRQKHMPLNTYVSLNKPLYDDSEMTLMDVIGEGNAINPEDIMINREQYKLMGIKIEEILSKLECQVLGLYLDGKPYLEIAQILGKAPKSIDNALQRIKRKVERFKAS